MDAKRESAELTPEAQLRACIDRLDARNQELFRAVRTRLRKSFPTANELVYDYTRSLVVGYSPTDKGIDSILAIAARDSGVSLYFNQAPRLPDPKRLLRRSGKQARFMDLEAAGQLAHADVAALIAAAIDQAKIPFASAGKGSLIAKSPATKKRRAGSRQAS